MRSLVALLGVSVLIGTAAPARSDPADDTTTNASSATLLESLRAAGITYNRTDLVIATAEAVCTLAAKGVPGPEIVVALQSRNPGLTPERAGQFLAIAMRSYCPNQLAPGNSGSPGGPAE